MGGRDGFAGDFGRDAGVLEQPGNGVGWQGALGEPLLDLFGVDGELDRVGPGVVVAERLDGTAVPSAAAVHDDDAVGRLLGCPDAAETNSNCHVRACSSWDCGGISPGGYLAVRRSAG